MHMSENMFWLPDSPKLRSHIIRCMDWATTLAHGKDLFDAAVLAERHGFRIEQLLANPFAQDQMLADSARFKSVIDLGRQILAQQPPPSTQPYQETPFRQAAAAFVEAFDEEAKACHASFEQAHRRHELCETEECRKKVWDGIGNGSRMATGVGGQEGCYLYCEYTKERLRRFHQRATKLE